MCQSCNNPAHDDLNDDVFDVFGLTASAAPARRRHPMTLDHLPDAQFLAATNLIKSHVAPGHDILELRVTPSWAGKHVYVACNAGLRPGTHAYDDATTAERFARSGFHVCIGARGAIKHLK